MFFYFLGINTHFKATTRYHSLNICSSWIGLPQRAALGSFFSFQFGLCKAVHMVCSYYEGDINPLSCMSLPVVNTLHVFNIFLVPLGCHVMPESYLWGQGNKQTSLVICQHNSIRTGLKRTKLPNVFFHNAKCICPMSTMPNVFVPIAKCICQNCQMYLFKLPNIFVLLLTCMILSRRVCRGRQRRVHEVGRSRRTQPSGQFCCSQ